jgi:amino-acid N-acetyltransferase
VDRARRGEGLGHRLTQAALDLAGAHGVNTVYLLTTTAGAFFPRFGFRQITRDQVNPAVQRSVEFTTVCPASAIAMRADLGP